MLYLQRYPMELILYKMNIKYTTGNLLYDSFGTEYVGYYFSENNLYYAGRVKTNKDIELYTKEDIRNKRYRVDNGITNIEQSRPKLHTPEINPEDYKNGYFYRYIAQKRGIPSSIVEISRDQHSSYGTQVGINSTLWKVELFKWVLVGELSSIIRENSKTLKQLEKEFPLIKNYFKNLSQYAEHNSKQF